MMKTKQIIAYITALIFGITFFTSCVDNDDYSIPPIPPEGFFKETFANVTDASGNPVSATVRPKIDVAMNFDNGAPVTYSDPTGRCDVRLLSGVPCVWFPTSTTLSSSLIVDGLPTEGRTNMTLRYYFNAGVYNAGETSNANKLIVKCNGVEVTVPDIPMTTANSRNTFIPVKIRIPDGTTKIEFDGIPTNNTYGFRISKIEIIENYPWSE